ncbi:MAG: hypothetical protein Q4G65_12705 [bacterium]|nr:hypothetical protein [bacterium]
MKAKTLFSVCALAVGWSAFADSADDAVALAERTISYVEKARVDQKALGELVHEYKLDKDWLAKTTNVEMRASIEREIRRLRRAILFLHPDLNFDKLLAVQRGLPYTWDLHMVDQYVGKLSRPGPGLIVLTDWKTNPKKTRLLGDKLPEGTVLNPDLHWDADKIVFAFCDHTRKPPKGFDPRTYGFHPDAGGNPWISKLDPENPLFKDGKAHPDVEAQQAFRRYFLYECAADGSWVRQLTGTARDKMETRDGRQTVVIEDVDPCYLPDGGIVFTSTRGQNFGRCHWGRYTPSFLLYRCDGNGDAVTPLSFGEANEWEPAVLNDGRIVYTRWDYIVRNAVWHQSLWTTRPDGTGVAHYYGNYSERVCVDTEAKAIPGTSRIVATATAHHSITQGSLFLLDVSKGEDGDAPITRLTPESPFPESESWDLGTTFCSPMPVNDTLFFCARSMEPMSFPKGHMRRHTGSCGASWPSHAAFGIWLVDTLGGRELIYKDAECSTFNPIPMVKRTKPPVLASILPPAETAPTTGVCYVENVYESRLDIPKGSITALRVNKLHNMPACRRETMHQGRDLELYKESLGIVPVDEKGACAFRIPVGEPIQLQALDTNGMAIVTMRSFIYSQKGEVQGCTGCHEQKYQAAPPTKYAGRTVIDPIKEVELGYEGPFSYYRSVRPIFEAKCVTCHTGGEGKPPYLGGLDGQRFMVNKKHVKFLSSYKETHISTPYDFYAAASPLTKRLQTGHGGVKLTPDEWKKIILWMDFNVPEFSHGGGYSWNRIESPSTNKCEDIQGTCGKGTACDCRSCWIRIGELNKPSAK